MVVALEVVRAPLPWPVTVETHTARLYFVGDRVYKAKKPVALGFLDFRSREARQRACMNEVDLNRRLAPDVYLGVADVVDGTGAPVDHLVVMRRLPAERRLAALVVAGAPDVEDSVVDVARLMAAFHDRCPVLDGLDSPGAPDAVARLWREELDQFDACVEAVVPGHEQLAALASEARARASAYVDGRDALFADRLHDGWVRDGHGDLLADDVFILDDGPRILDCLDFDTRLRGGDVLADIGFLAMDLERLGAPQLADRLLADYREFTAETHPRSLEHFYVAYRAHVRAKVAAVRLGQGCATAAADLRSLLELAVRHLRRGTVRLVLVGGLPGSGKTTVAGALAGRCGWLHLSSDVIRKELALVPADHREPVGVDEGLYRPALTAATYTELLVRAEVALQHGESVVLDATWWDAGQRARARSLAVRVVATLTEVRCRADEKIEAARVASRLAQRTPDPSDADEAVRRAMAARFQDWPEAVVVDTGDSVDAATDAVAAAMDRSVHAPL